jgi:hypothetical protein
MKEPYSVPTQFGEDPFSGAETHRWTDRHDTDKQTENPQFIVR